MSATVEERVNDIKRRLTLIHASCALFSFVEGPSLADQDDVLDGLRMLAQESLDILAPLHDLPANVACWTPDENGS